MRWSKKDRIYSGYSASVAKLANSERSLTLFLSNLEYTGFDIVMSLMPSSMEQVLWNPVLTSYRDTFPQCYKTPPPYPTNDISLGKSLETHATIKQPFTMKLSLTSTAVLWSKFIEFILSKNKHFLAMSSRSN